jgi:hypothetical protein
MELESIRKVQQQLQEVNQAGLSRLKMKEKYGKDPRVWTFYNTISVMLEELLLAVKVAASGIVDHKVEGKLGKAGGIIHFLGEVVAMVPCIGETGSFFVTKSGEAIEAVDHARQGNMLKRVSRLGTLSELQDISFFLAKFFTERYERLLRLLPTAEEQQARSKTPAKALQRGSSRGRLKGSSSWTERFKVSVTRTKDRVVEKVEKTVLDKDPKSPSESLAEFVLGLVWDALQEENLKNEAAMKSGGPDLMIKMLKQDLVEKVVFRDPKPPGKLATAFQKLLQRASSYQVQNMDGTLWTFSGILRCCGVETETGFYIEEGWMDPATFGYCCGLEEEVKNRKLVLVKAKGSKSPTPRTSSASAAPTPSAKKSPRSSSVVGTRSTSPPPDPKGGVEALEKGENAFHMFDKDRNGELDEGEWLECWDEILVLEERFSNATFDAAALKEAFLLLCKGNLTVSKEDFLVFFQKAYHYSLVKAISLLRRKSESVIPVQRPARGEKKDEEAPISPRILIAPAYDAPTPPAAKRSSMRRVQSGGVLSTSPKIGGKLSSAHRASTSVASGLSLSSRRPLPQVPPPNRSPNRSPNSSPNRSPNRSPKRAPNRSPSVRPRMRRQLPSVPGSK